MMRLPAGLSKTATLIAGEFLLVALALFAMDGLAHLRLEVGQFLAGWGAWAAALIVARVLRKGSAVPAWGAMLVESVAPGFVINELSAWGRGGFTPAQTLYTLVSVTVLLHGWRIWTTRLDAKGGDVAGDGARVLLVGAGAFGVALPLFTDRLVGGTDARWYAYMLGDFIEQLRAGVFPVFIGQGDLAWNGGVHPFRSAPVYMHMAGLWDILTFRALSTCALQHLAAITAAFGAGLGTYAAGAALVPRRKWEAAGVALLYLCAPAVLEALYNADAYMTWMATGVLPLAFYGNVRALNEGDRFGYAVLAAGLALVWMCHPPLAMLTTMATLLLQGGFLLCGDVTSARLRAAAEGALLFAALGAYYFYGMSELPADVNGSFRGDALQLGGLGLWLAGLGSAVVRRRGGWWLLLLAPGGWLMWTARTPWLWWMVVTATLTTLTVVLARWRKWFDPAAHAVEVLLPCTLLGAGIAQAWVGSADPARDPGRLSDLNLIAAQGLRYFMPLSLHADQQGDWQPGLGLWAALVALGVAFFRKRPLVAKLWFAIALLPLFIIVKIPWISEFLVGYAPREFAMVAGLTFLLRLMPVLSAMLAMGWLVWLSTQSADGRLGRRLTTFGLSLAVGWSIFDASKVVRHGFQATATHTHTEDEFRSENAVLERFAYDLLTIPAYYSNGITDPRLEVRALDTANQVKIGPDVTALRMEEAGRREMQLACLPYEPPAPGWFQLGPTLTVAPGEHLLLRFEFDPQKNYSGYLFLKSAHSYREYSLPESGFPRAFGTSEKASRVVSLWNTGPVAERYEFSFRRNPGCTLSTDGSLFAKVFVSHFDAARALVHVDSLMPYRVTLATREAGFVETPRVWLPGYEATVDGQPALVLRSKERLAMVSVAAGSHTVELRYVGTTAHWIAWSISALTWMSLLGLCAWRPKQKC